MAYMASCFKSLAMQGVTLGGCELLYTPRFYLSVAYYVWLFVHDDVVALSARVDIPIRKDDVGGFLYHVIQ